MNAKNKTRIEKVTLVASGYVYRTIAAARAAAAQERRLTPGILAHGIVIDRVRGNRRWSENEIL